MKEELKEEFRAWLIISFMATIFFLVSAALDFSSVSLFSPVLFVLWHYSWTRKFGWIPTVIQVGISSFLFIGLFSEIVIYQFNKLVESGGIFGVFNSLLTMILIVPVIFFVSFLTINFTFKIFSDFALNRMNIKIMK